MEEVSMEENRAFSMVAQLQGTWAAPAAPSGHSSINKILRELCLDS